MLFSPIKKYVWEKGEEWQEKWYSTELCFRTFAKGNNPLAKYFAPEGLNVLALNTIWFYEKRTSKSWDEGKDRLASNLSSLNKLIQESESFLNRAQLVLNQLENLENIDGRTLDLFKGAFILLWSVFLSDLGRPIGQILDQRLKSKRLESDGIELVKDYCFKFDHMLGFQLEEKNLNRIRKLYERSYKGEDINYSQLSVTVKKQLIAHCKEFQYLTGTDLDTEPYTPGDFFQKLKMPQTKVRSSSAQITNKIKQKLSKEDLKFIDLVKRHIFIDNFAGDVNSKLDFRLNSLLSKIFKLSLKELSWYSFEEIEQLVRSGKKLTKGQVEERKSYRSMWQIDGEMGACYGEVNYRQVENLTGYKATTIKVKDIKGMVACRGLVKGRVKIVREIKDVSKVRSGDILVSTNTHPDLMLAIKRCAGIITDYGGITSHAAIISREFNIPCIVGTSIATQVLKDGDLVNLDANKGIVRIVNEKNRD